MNWKEEIKKVELGNDGTKLRALISFLTDLSKGANPTAEARRYMAEITGIDEDVLMHLSYSK